ncbi:MAG: UvrB/UvrC motif-containing protein, partial [Syntrophobacterales bacterium]
PSMARAVEETNRRRRLQEEYNETHGITPETIRKEIHDILDSVYEGDYVTVATVEEEVVEYKTIEELDQHITELENQMKEAAAKLEFEEAARLRDEIRDLKAERLEVY